jgi:hypothetical protein
MAFDEEILTDDRSFLNAKRDWISYETVMRASRHRAALSAFTIHSALLPAAVFEPFLSITDTSPDSLT